MGQVRLIIKSVNAIDEGLARRGYISEKEIRSGEFDAMVDAGSVATVIPFEITELLDLNQLENAWLNMRTP